MEFKIPLKNKNNEIISYSLVDKEDYENINKFSWYLSTYGYAQGYQGFLHRFILGAKKEDPIIDHINNDRLDNRKNNLIFATRSQNSQNRKKKENCSSNYIGVSYDNKSEKWRCNIMKKGIYFKNEEHAAYWYDQLALKHFGQNAKINGIEKPENFQEPIEKIKTLPKGVTLNKCGSYRAYIQNNGKRIHIGTFKTIQEAEIAYNNKKEQFYKEQEDEISSQEIIRNSDGIAIIKTKKDEEILVDDDKYYQLIQYTWNTTKNYAQTYINKKIIMMHRFLMDAKENELIDHINNNKLDNRLSNLRISNPSFNSHNKTKQSGTTSKYTGVHKTKYGKYKAKITKDGKQYHVGTFRTENDAVLARDKKAQELYGNYAKINT